MNGFRLGKLRWFFPRTNADIKVLDVEKGKKPVAVFDKRGLELRPHLQQQGVYGGACRAQVHIQV